MGVTATHQLSSFSSPVNGSSPVDANQVRGNDNAIRSSYNAHDADATIHLQTGLVASRPSPSLSGQSWLATDTGAVYLYTDTGSAWVEANYLRNTGGTVTGNVSITGTLGVTGAVTGGTYNGQTITTAASFTGSVVVANGLTVSAGTTAVQALTATTITAAGTSITGGAAQTNVTAYVGNGLRITGSVSNAAQDAITYQSGGGGGIAIAFRRGGSFDTYLDFYTSNVASGSGALVRAGGFNQAGVLDVAGGIIVTGNSTITGTLGGITTLTATTFSGALAGNATTATTLQTARAINGVNFDGSAAITVTAAAGTLTGATLASNVLASSLTSVGILASPHMTSPVVDSGGIAVTGGTVSDKLNSLSGSLIVTTSVATTLFTAVYAAGTYLVSTTVSGTGAMGFAIVTQSATTNVMLVQVQWQTAAGAAAISISGLNVQVTTNVASNPTVTWSATRLA